jgi:hypothetical protein
VIEGQHVLVETEMEHLGVSCVTAVLLNFWSMMIFHSISQHSCHLIAEVKNEWSYTSYSLYAFMVCILTALLLKIKVSGMLCCVVA